MNKTTPTPPSSRARPAPRRSGRAAARFSRQEKLILALVALLGSVVLALAVFVLLVYLPGQPTAALPPEQAPMPTNAVLDTPLPSQPAAAALPAGCAQVDGPIVQATVNQIGENGTLQVQLDGQPVQVTYAGVEVFASSRTAEVVGSLLQGQVVTLIGDNSERDSEGQLVRYVFSGDRFINLELVRQGLAAAVPAGPDRACAGLLQQAELRARADQVGVWKPTPAPTRTFMPFVDISTASACDCSIRYECSDFSTRAEAQTCYNACNDYNSRLDDDRDGIACENLP